ncbi:MbcA/ParS/Xre antitoxin family protein [Burkholderia vietnamiensis]|uniref:MbcA/ParS/Xre antitoxin family protein n=1 Tax=Burkholderia vietnamiensis TaxID=60552 RepID=UPI001E399719|nr:MbcA/ParS/Xre antitoxin family protein [Burkholderia vietnamiensis]
MDERFSGQRCRHFLCYKCAYSVHRESFHEPRSGPRFNAPLDFDHFLASLKDSESAAPIVSARRFAAALHIDMQTLARLAHVHRNTISRLPGAESVQKYLRDALRVIRAATDISGDIRSTLFWYRNEPLPTFGYKTAEELISEGRTEDLLRYITSLEASASG